VGDLRFRDLKPGETFVFEHKNGRYPEGTWYVKDPTAREDQDTARYYRTRGALRLSETLYAPRDRPVVRADTLPWWEEFGPCGHPKRPSYNTILLIDEEIFDLVLAAQWARVRVVDACQDYGDPWLEVAGCDDALILLSALGDDHEFAEVTAFSQSVDDVLVGVVLRITIPWRCVGALAQELWERSA
jgi:hypothetical protein